MLPLPFILIANSAVGKSWAHIATGVLAGILAGATFLGGALDLAGAPVFSSGIGAQARLGLDVGVMATGFAAAAMTSETLRARLSRWLPVDPKNPVHALALALAVIVIGTQLSIDTFTDVLAAEQAQPPLGIADLLYQDVPFLILAVAGVGIFVRRNPAATLARLGVFRPAWWHIALALAAAGLFFVLSGQVDTLSHVVSPDLAHRVDVTSQHLFGGLDGPLAIAAIAIVPAVCEELLFRGALQPRLGLVVTALLFTSFHAQYSYSLDAAFIFAVAIGLGLIRKYTNTTTACLTHASYNLLSAVSITGLAAVLGGAAEVGLLAAVAYALWSGRRPAPEPVKP